MSEPPMSEPTPLEAIFFAALAKAPGERAAFLTEACVGDKSLRSRLERMLAAQARSAPPSANGSLVGSSWNRWKTAACLLLISP